MALGERLKKLREPDVLQPRPIQRVITVRMKKELHEQLKERAYEQRLSMNDLCVAVFEEAVESLKPQGEAVGQ